MWFVPSQPLYPLADRILGGDLADRLRAFRSEGLSFEAIARELSLQGIEVSGETVRKWCAGLAPEPEAAQS